MHNFATIAPDRSQTSGIELFRVWDVDADQSYQIKRQWDVWDGPDSQMPIDGRTGYCAARTISGQGWVKAEDGEKMVLKPDSIMVAPWLALEGWGAEGKTWRFYWFEFFADEADALLLPKPAPVVSNNEERSEIIAIQSQIRSPAQTARRAASARFSAMLYGWLDRASAVSTRRRNNDRIDRVIELMHQRVDQQLSVAEMAEHAGLGQRTFANAFEQATGQTPKRYHLNIRLDAVRALLLTQQANVTQAAEQFGFSSPFYLSKLYSKRYGHPPSQAH